MADYKFIKNCDIYTPLKTFKKGGILIEGEKIAKVGSFKESEIPDETQIYNFQNHLAVPGFIDIHVHGGAGIDFTDSSPESMTEALRTHLQNGTTSLLPTIETASHKQILQTIRNFTPSKREIRELPHILGLNLEGPYISKEKRGAQLKKFIRKPSVAEMKEYIEASKKNIKVVTLAPEIEGALDFIHFLRDQEIIPSAGHTNARYLETEKAVKSGIRHATHLFNAMRGFFHRAPGAAGCLLLKDEVSAEIIADGFHLHPLTLHLIERVKPLGKIILVTDATKFYGIKKEPSYDEEGRLFGSSTPLNEAVKNMIQFTGLSFEETLRTVTSNPAKILKMEHKKGHLKKDKDADIVILDKELRVRKVFLKGKIVPTGKNINF